MAFKKVGDVPESVLQSAAVSSELIEETEQALAPFQTQYQELRKDIRTVAQQGVSLEDAERLGAKFLDALLELGGMDGVIQKAAFDAKLKKNGYKTLKAKVYLQTVQGSEKKPTEAMLDAIILTNVDVIQTQDLYEKAEEYVESLKRVYDVFRDCHIYFRGIAKGAFNGS